MNMTGPTMLKEISIFSQVPIPHQTKIIMAEEYQIDNYDVNFLGVFEE